ncbi:UDP-N-acetylmuramate--alanine ligase [Knoellia sinensis KCTC 19936]|uniref:UDP-N-acetylmuramate--L-alanine ligase n=1 Tax=Knoellia sinensis KCTC 19936 TaxID=1385520 RepID=A0A0A0J8N8_9MICO|nr:UDP-N-acetylmuramate--L-alanine ligase [Knoellia sinensis]KGN33119.1 UDP-N-acetylmuramate--alanine ligase [Knoellia sinensis KCTC 19936]
MQGRNARFDFTSEVPGLETLGRVHFIAIGGSGMSAVARIMLARGVVVSGSDAKDSAVLETLRGLGATITVGHDPAHVEGVDTVVISSAIPETNVELAAARVAGCLVLHRSQGLAATMKDARPAAVAGANGKTTTTSMLTVALQAAGLDPSFASGGELAGQGTNAAWGSGDVFVVEADESDGSFLVYRPEVAIVTNVQPDHLDFYGTFDNVEAAYAEFAESLRSGGLLVACADDAGSERLAARASAAGTRVLTYGFDATADLRLADHRADDEGIGTTTVLHRSGGDSVTLRLATPGSHNALNAAAAYLAATEGFGAHSTRVLDGLAEFDGARRRFEIRGDVAGVTVVDDYAHNAGKVAAVVATAAEIAGRRGGRLLVAFQPHLYSRTRDFAGGFAAGLAPADTVVLLDIYGAREQPAEGITSELIAAPLRELPGERSVTVGGSFESIAADLAAEAQPGDLVLTVGAGDVTALASHVLRALEER